MMRSDSKLRVLYIVYWGASEPLGQSLVLPSVKRLADLGVALTLVTFEKPEDLARQEVMSAIRVGLDEHGIQWIPLRYHKYPKVPATAYDIGRGLASGIMAGLRERPDVIHARTFVGGLIGLVLAPLVGARLIYHNEGFYPDEQVDGGVWKANSAPHRLATWLELRMYSRADAIVSMSHRGKRVIEGLMGVSRKGIPVIVVPSCVDLSHFRWNPTARASEPGTLRLVYVGSVGGRYIFNKVGKFAALARQEIGAIRLRVLTPADPAVVASMLSKSGLAQNAWSVDKVPHSVMPGELESQDAGLFFLSQGLSEHGCSPTKIGEYWAMGLPVITTPNVSDTDEIIRQDRVGVVVEGHSDDDYRRAVRELQLLLQDTDLPFRCRRAAERHYALEPACERQLALYHSLVPRMAQAAVQASASELGNS